MLAQTIRDAIDKPLKQREVAIRLGVGIRQIKRLVKRYRHEGAAGLVSKQRGRLPNNAICPELKRSALALIQDHYSDFAPTFAHDQPVERHRFRFSVETLRQWMIGEGVWKANTRSKARIHQARPRRDREGELVLIDGSPHGWFEGRAPYCTLIVFIDDATGKLQSLRFAGSETTQAYMETPKDYSSRHGRPVSLYSDKHSIFRVNA